MHRDLKPENIGIVFEGEHFENDQERDKYIEQFDFSNDRHKLHVLIMDYGLA